MKGSLPPILVVDDERNMRLSLESILEEEGYALETVENAEVALQRLEKAPCLMVITDAQLEGMSGYELLDKIRQRWPDLPVLVITAYATPKLAVQAIKAGAMDYLSKPFEPEELLHAVARCAERHHLLRENASLRSRAQKTYRLEQIIGECPAMVELRHMISTVALSNATVLILGESGTGKELVAGAIHHMSARRDASYIRLNCAAIPENLLESELFGHEKGSFTGAVKQKIGRVQEADGGTLFLDEIGDMSRPLQAKLLRFLEDGSFTRVGGNQELRVQVRVLAATNRDIVEAIRENEFREDLFHRLNVVQLRLPPLRERGRDIVLLADHFLRRFNHSLGKHVAGLSGPARDKLLSHHWPGNVRELRNVMERSVILETTGEVQARTLPDFQLEERLRKGETPSLAADQPLDERVAEFERTLILNTLEQHHFNLTRTAEELKISRHALRYRMQRLHLPMGADKDEETAVAEGKEGHT